MRRGTVLHQAVDDLVDRAVAPDRHHEVDALGGGLGAELARVPPVRGLDDVELQLAAEGSDEHVAHLGVVLVAAGLTTTSARMTARLTT